MCSKTQGLHQSMFGRRDQVLHALTVAAPMYWSNSAAAVESNAGIILKLPQQLRWP